MIPTLAVNSATLSVLVSSTALISTPQISIAPLCGQKWLVDARRIGDSRSLISVPRASGLGVGAKNSQTDWSAKPCSVVPRAAFPLRNFGGTLRGTRHD